MKRILTVIGARPQFIKVGPVSNALGASGQWEEIIVHTGQHFDEKMSDIFFRQLQLPTPTLNLGIGGGSHATQTAAMMIGLESAMLEYLPDIVLVYGDTNSTLAGALAAAKLDIPIAHVEAGLRSFNRQMPEEINRIITDRISSLLFTPSAIASTNLDREGFNPKSIFQVGDVMYDAVLNNIGAAQASSIVLKELPLTAKDYYLVTLHRAENTDNSAVLSFLADEIMTLASQQKVIFPIHPRTKKALSRIGLLERMAREIELIEPRGYLDTLTLIENASLVLTDSGGMQKEAMFLKTPCITLRKETEWLETLDAGANCLFHTESGSLADLAKWQLAQELVFEQTPYGTGQAASSIAKHLVNFLN